MTFEDNLVQLGSIDNAEQAQAIEDFLRAEEARHRRECGVLDEAALLWLSQAIGGNIWGDHPYSYDYCVTRAVMDRTASIRHWDDVSKTHEKRLKLHEKWGTVMEGACK